MTTFIAGLLEAATWDIIFGTAFFFGLFFFILVILGSFGGDSDDIDSEGDFDSSGEAIDLDGDGMPDGIDLDGDGIIDVEFDGDFGDVDFDADMDSDFDTDMDSDIDDITYSDFDTHITLGETLDAEITEEDPVFQSTYKMGNISSFLFFFGLVGWPVSNNLQDFHIALSVVVGLMAAKIFAYFIATYAKTVIVPLKPIRRGDVAEVRYSVTPEKAGMITIIRRDGIISTEMARGAFAHDFFERTEKGYVWDRKSGIYLITRGVIGQPDLQSEKPKKKK